MPTPVSVPSYQLSRPTTFSTTCFFTICWLLAVLALSTGCETIARQEKPELKMVAITDSSQVAGKWEGLLRWVPPTKTDGVTLIVLPDGRFRFLSARTIGILSGEGVFSVVDDHLAVSTERGSIDLSLFEGEGQRLLRATGRSRDGSQFNAELTPTESRNR